MVYPVHITDKKFKNCMDLLLITNGNKSHYVYIKNLTGLCIRKKSVKVKNIFENIDYNVLVVKELW